MINNNDQFFVKLCLAQKTELFADRLQHDCQEFVQIFLDLLHKELNCVQSTGNGADEKKEKEKKPDDETFDSLEEAQKAEKVGVKMHDYYIEKKILGVD